MYRANERDMIDPLDDYNYQDRWAAVGLADTLHNLGVIDDDAFDLLLVEIYLKYGVTYGDISDNDYL